MPPREVVTAPPVRQATTVRADVTRTFDVFVREIGLWWPVEPFSTGRDRARDVSVEPRLGGSVVETWDDGTVRPWGRLVAWDPPRGFTMSWLLTPEPTEVELRFQALGPALTRVSVEHRGWERMTEEQLGGACALPEGYRGGSYLRGWGIILGRLAVRVDEGAP
ncbi:SRPBCC domain-containing protein [Cellulomonas fengjieae]|uniref:SRPBCC domain-containing protein n=1 Tax=Cellulomonas fengjieae TaxID=2819978 RepID=A0ABS3SEK4_9CELL|nr:SRPBCC domain-containing protein [Cellulomonas fengjieae]MBO3084188.1 SRPBCC domain-containing protein [Cellulomonas fengjieae]MBO3103592.1 SRPBCC domain-containing protein [Cellulomonas fengjieae]QVI64567.1 SRPBCC domain-containing protein [Cellulomonas fengjieae]